MQPAPTMIAREGRFAVTRRETLAAVATIAATIVAAILAIVCGACGGSSYSSGSNTLSAAQAQALSQQVVQAVVAALDSGLGIILPADSRPSLSAVFGGLHPDQSSGCTPTMSGQDCNFPLSYTGPCSGGGTISVSGDIQGMLNNSGSGSIDAQLAITPANCSVSNFTFNGAPDISIDNQINYGNSGPIFPIDLTEGGGITYGPHPSGTCQLNVTYSINSLSSCTVTGTVCGQSVSGSC